MSHEATALGLTIGGYILLFGFGWKGWAALWFGLALGVLTLAPN